MDGGPPSLLRTIRWRLACQSKLRRSEDWWRSQSQSNLSLHEIPDKVEIIGNLIRFLPSQTVFLWFCTDGSNVWIKLPAKPDREFVQHYRENKRATAGIFTAAKTTMRTIIADAMAVLRTNQFSKLDRANATVFGDDAVFLNDGRRLRGVEIQAARPLTTAQTFQVAEVRSTLFARCPVYRLCGVDWIGNSAAQGPGSSNRTESAGAENSF